MRGGLRAASTPDVGNVSKRLGVDELRVVRGVVGASRPVTPPTWLHPRLVQRAEHGTECDMRPSS
jgi:hypothetical protein